MNGGHPRWDIPGDDLESFDRDFILSGMAPSAKVVRVGAAPVKTPDAEPVVGSVVERRHSSKKPVVFQPPKNPPQIVIKKFKSKEPSEHASIDAENAARIHSMSPEEIIEAQEQIRASIPPKMLEKLMQKNRD